MPMPRCLAALARRVARKGLRGANRRARPARAGGAARVIARQTRPLLLYCLPSNCHRAEGCTHLGFTMHVLFSFGGGFVFAIIGVTSLGLGGVLFPHG